MRPAAENAELPTDLRDGHFTGGEPRLHYKIAGQGYPVIMLHGFPDFWYGWRRQLGPLVEHGYQVVAPDQRGYNLSDKPTGVRPYAIAELANDVLRLADELWPGEQFALVGHDWGAAVAWWVAIHQPERLNRLVIINVPHPVVFEQHLRHPSQALKSWYILFFQLPWLPEWALGRRDCWGLIRLLQASSGDGAFSDTDLAVYRAAWKQPGTLTAALNWYREVVRHRPRIRGSARVTVPSLILWGAQDVALASDMAEPSRAYCADGRLVMFNQASHWPHLDEWEAVNAELVRFLEVQ
jgi:epoxide hydrolase 4